MAVGSRLLSLFTLSSVAVLICSFQATPVSALTVQHSARGMHHRDHDALAKRKRSTTKRCRPRSASSASADPSSTPAPSSSSSSSSAAAPSSTASSNGGNSGNNSQASPPGGGSKLALAWANGDQDLSSWGSASLLYTWSPACPEGSIQCCPMLWGWNQVDQFNEAVQKNPPKCAMGMNEPEIPGQSNIAVGDGITMWNQHIRPLGQKGTYLYSPATTSDPAGKQWMQAFFDGCGGDDKCGVNAIALHWYDTTGDKLIAYLEDIHNTFKLALFLSEFACQNFNGGPQCTSDQVKAFAVQVAAFMLATEWIKLYAPFGAMHDMQGVNSDNQLMGSNGQPNALAQVYGY